MSSLFYSHAVLVLSLKILVHELPTARLLLAEGRIRAGDTLPDDFIVLPVSNVAIEKSRPAVYSSVESLIGRLCQESFRECHGRFIDFFDEYLECLTLLRRSSHLRSIEPSTPWTFVHGPDLHRNGPLSRNR